MKNLITSFMILASVVALSSCNKNSSSTPNITKPATSPSGQSAPTSELKNIVEIASEDSRFSTLVAAVVAADLQGVLAGEGPYTVLAPTNDAFAKLPAGTVEALLKPENKATLQNILLYHVLAGSIEAKTVISLSGQSVKTASGQDIKIKFVDGKVFINDSQVIITDIKAKNGIIHVIDSVLLPPPQKDIVETAVAAGEFKTLAAALGAAGLVDTLKGPGPFTVFAPTDAAFAKLPEGTVDALLKDIPSLTNILVYHVAAGDLSASNLIEQKMVVTLQGKSVEVRSENGMIYLNNSLVIGKPVQASNGIIYVIDTVLLP
jgi:transforming growth factor-beta-induced protein